VSALAQLLKAAGLHDVRYRRLGFGTVSVHWGEKAEGARAVEGTTLAPHKEGAGSM